MAVQMSQLMVSVLPELRVHPVDKRIKASVAGSVVLSSGRARLVWEPRRVVPTYAVPRDDVAGQLLPFTGTAGTEHAVRLGADGPLVLDPSTPFSVHSTPGEPLTIRTEHGELAGAAFAPEDPDLDGYVVLDWSAFSQWYEEDEPVVGHPHDPFDRIDCLRSSRHVVLSVDGEVLAETRRAVLLFETPLPARYYIPREDVRAELFEPSDLKTVCAYKGEASYLSARVGDRLLPDVAWTYQRPLNDAVPVKDMISFFTERLDLVIDGAAVERPVTPWS